MSTGHFVSEESPTHRYSSEDETLHTIHSTRDDGRFTCSVWWRAARRIENINVTFFNEFQYERAPAPPEPIETRLTLRLEGRRADAHILAQTGESFQKDGFEVEADVTIEQVEGEALEQVVAAVCGQLLNKNYPVWSRGDPSSGVIVDQSVLPFETQESCVEIVLPLALQKRQAGSFDYLSAPTSAQPL